MASVKLKEGVSLSINKRDFVLVSQKGQGGNGVVWSAESEGQSFAIKVVDEKNSKRQLERSKAEAEFCHRHDHANVVKVIDYEITDGRMMMVMPLYEGSLRKVMESNDFSVTDRLNFAIRLAEGVGYIHSKDAVHRDLKPENLLVKEKHLVICDFGIAHFEDSNVTRKNDLVANRNYAAPEQRVKGAADRVGKPSDVYAVGCIINELFTGQNPVGSSFAKVFDFYPFLYEIDELVESCTRQDPDERPSIELVEAKLKLIRGEAQDKLENIMGDLSEDLENADLSTCRSRIESQLRCMSEDLLNADYLFQYLPYERINEINDRYHEQISYSLSKDLESKCYSALILNMCKDKFMYESGAYSRDTYYLPLNLETEPKHIELFDRFCGKLAQYNVESREILKLFASCADYHCVEMLADLKKIEQSIAELHHSPINYLVIRLRHIFDEIPDLIEDPLHDYLMVDWDSIERRNYSTSDLSSDTLFPGNMLNRENVTEILGMFHEKYQIMWQENKSGYLIIFPSQEMYRKFREYALELASPYYDFEGCVLDILRVSRCYSGVVELKPWCEYDVRNTLAKVLGIRKDY